MLSIALGEEPVLSEAVGDPGEPSVLPDYQQVQYFKKQTASVKPEAGPTTNPATTPPATVEAESYSKVPTEDLSSLTPGR